MSDYRSLTLSNLPMRPLGPAIADSQAANPMECSLRWRQGKLWVSSMVRGQDIPLPALANGDWFLACLTKSRATAVCIDPSLGTEVISLWTQACQAAQKPLFLRIPASPHRPANQKPGAWAVKRGCDRLVALLLLVGLSPLFLLIAGLIKAQDNGPALLAEWRVGQRGRMVQIFKFRTTVKGDRALTESMGIVQADLTMTALGRWLKRSHLDKLPLLFNVLRGDLSLVGPHPWAIYETLTLPWHLRARLHTLPGITGSLRRFSQFPTATPKPIVLKELQDLRQWSLWKDLKQLTATTFQVFG
jgi:lipopolysaccharide/colanic/teichoic acid biosynthesis glycosyltransferase